LLIEWAKKLTVIGAAASMLAGFFAWGWNMHNQYLIETISPLLRASYSQRINNYRKLDCMNALSIEAYEAMLDVMQAYEDLVGRPISDRDCDSL